MTKIRAGDWRDDSTGPMEVVSGPTGKERVHFQAPPASRLDGEMRAFLDWFNAKAPCSQPRGGRSASYARAIVAPE